MWSEFRKFALKGNVIDLAVGVIIGAAFGKIVSSLVDDILMPVLGIFLGGINLSALTFTVQEAQIKYGAFLQTILDFLIVGFSIFLFVRAINKYRKKNEQPPAPPKPDKQVELLTEIRDLLKKQ